MTINSFVQPNKVERLTSRVHSWRRCLVTMETSETGGDHLSGA